MKGKLAVLVLCKVMGFFIILQARWHIQEAGFKVNSQGLGLFIINTR